MKVEILRVVKAELTEEEFSILLSALDLFVMHGDSPNQDRDRETAKNMRSELLRAYE